MSFDESVNLSELARDWAKKIDQSEKKYDDFFRLVKETRDAYKAHAKSLSENLNLKSAFNIFWSGIETQKPFLYFKQPKPFLERVNKIANPVEALACKILENALQWDLQQFDFDSVIKYARNDYLISGCGILWERYKPEFMQIMDDNGQFLDIKSSEKVVSEYVDPCNLLIDTDHVGVWEDVVWVARKHFMTRKQAVENFGVKACAGSWDNNSDNEDLKQVVVYEIWDKNAKKVLWLCKNPSPKFLKIEDNPLNVHGFFPCSKPIFATQANDSLIPTPDYSMIKADLDELNSVIERMRLTMKALKVTGAYDNAFSNLANILNKDVTLLALSDFDKLKDAGGLKGVVDFMPIEQYVTALQALAQRRDDLVKNIFDITGVSDIMRGNSNASETATAVTKKTNFGTLRNQDRQNDMQRFIRDIYRLKAEIICEQFSAETLFLFLSPEEKANFPLAQQAVQLLKSDKMRGMSLNIETECVFNQQEQNAQNLEAVQTVSKLISDAFQIVSVQPLLLPLYRQMAETVISGMSRARAFEPVFEQVFNQIQKQLAQPKQPQVPQPTTAERLQAEKIQKDYEIEKEKNALKAKELEIKAKSEFLKSSLTDKEMNLQANLKAVDMVNQTKNSPSSSNISTGLVKPFV